MLITQGSVVRVHSGPLWQAAGSRRQAARGTGNCREPTVVGPKGFVIDDWMVSDEMRVEMPESRVSHNQ